MEIYVVSRVTASLLPSLHFFGVDLAAELDVGKGIAATVASIKNSKGESALHLGYEHIVLVHYRETLEDSPVTPINSNYASSYSDTSVPRPLSDETDSEANHALYMGSDTSFIGESVEPSSILTFHPSNNNIKLQMYDSRTNLMKKDTWINRTAKEIEILELKITPLLLAILAAQLEECVDKDAAEKSNVVKEATKAIFTPNADKTVSKGNCQIQEK
ncbi:hypothetical protein IFM89_033816 [Coptis chinensis]|uniref:Uncharacterized protein n=1 Tax=Coptis chinensis TaxID=261450 RepID=A0A835HNW6_9MAGN|nr:hypothetical protein IFM89_033816 [Coptis chinensis]